jgi:CBS domain-containing protein
VETAAISYRVADFLKNYPPFHVMDEEDLLKLTRRGRVKFFEPNEYVLAQGGSRLYAFVIQQGTVSLWDEKGAEARLLDVRGTGDMLGIDQLDHVRSYPYAARTTSDVLLYVFPIDEFDDIVLKYPYAKQYVSAYGSVTTDYSPSQERRDPHNVPLQELISGKDLATCNDNVSIRDAARQMLSMGADAIAVMDSEQRPRVVLTAASFLEWITRGAGNVNLPITLLDKEPLTIAAQASVVDGVLALGASNASALAITSDGTTRGRLNAIVTSQDLGRVFADRPVEILRDIWRAPNTSTLRDLNQRARAVALQYLTDAGSSEWLARFTALVDATIMRRIIAMAVPEEFAACWCFCEAAGRGESLTRLAPQVLMIADEGREKSGSRDAYQRVSELLHECDYLPNTNNPFDPSFYAASVSEWKKRYEDWVIDPILKEISRALSLFDLRCIAGPVSLWREVETAVKSTINHEFLHVLANDCLASLPPLTFFQNAVLEESGEETTVFRLEHSALRPLVDVGRVFGMAAKKVFGSSTLERFAVARSMLPEQASIFAEASETLRVVLWQQGRVGISQGTPGWELPPALLSRYDRQILKSCFRSILRLLEFTADLRWLKTL